ncbi:MAG: nucleotidyltransferase [Myxococcales bacterium]|nr:nucleotidyltransferase [Myxococcales bacterium]
MSLQSLFMRFHEAIQLKRFNENAELREKRDRILKRLRDNLSVSFDWFNQGSYAMGTGIKPLDDDYDIDIGIILNNVTLSSSPYRDRSRDIDLKTIKGWVFTAVEPHTSQVEWRRPCITVYYKEAGEVIYHVDLAVMVRDAQNPEQLYLAVGKQYESLDTCKWQLDDRKGFMDAIERKCEGEDGAQFRRVIRYLKRWKDENFPKNGHAAPTGLSLTVAAYYSFSPSRTTDYFSGRVSYDDLSATLAVAKGLRGRFTQTWNTSSGSLVHTVNLAFPFAPGDDVFGKMTQQQQEEFYQRLGQFISNLEQAQTTGNAAYLRRAFGDRFPVD